jgi:aconitate hydratase
MTNKSVNCLINLQILELDLASIMSCLSGPKRPHDQVALSQLHQEFKSGLTAKLSFKAYGLKEEAAKKRVEIELDKQKWTLGHGTVVISAITSCTNTSNPSVMLGAGWQLTEKLTIKLIRRELFPIV